ncbi:hypothetical protein GCM10022276_03960 [Sphingomonas limnosediminicola]|uniref:Uncharacterized protein n=1 Tax=Sphingomonas limnosediminicola TaxID=940133 RepID=A0ABP7KX22_9SPHN
MTDRDPFAFRSVQELPGGFRKPDLVFPKGLVRTLEQDRHDLAAVRTEQNLGPRGKTLRSADRAVCPHDDDGFPLSMQVQASDAQTRPYCRDILGYP